MGKITFGSSQRNLPTPTSIANLLDAMAGIFGIIIPALNAAPAQLISADTSLVWTWILGLAIPILLRLKVYFGIETNQTSVPIDKVSEMDNTSK